MPGENENNPAGVGGINALPAISTTPKTVKAMIIDGYRAAVAAMEAMGDEQNQWHERKRLFNGYRLGSKVEGVRSQTAVEMMFDRIIKEPIPPQYAPKLDHEGNKTYMFELSQHYHNKGRTVLARISDIVENGHRDRLQIGIETDGEGTRRLVVQAPNVPCIPCNVITIIMSADDSQFIAWFCGEPRKIVTLENLAVFLDVTAQAIQLDNIQVRVNRDFSAESEVIRREKRAQKRIPQHKPVVKHNTHREPRPLTSVAAVLTEAVADAAKQPESNGQP